MGVASSCSSAPVIAHSLLVCGHDGIGQLFIINRDSKESSNDTLKELLSVKYVEISV